MLLLERRASEARKLLLSMIYQAGSGHPGGSLSCVELITALAESELFWDQGYDPQKNPNRMILSKGHACPALYAVAMEYGLIAKEECLLFRQLGSILQGHPHVKTTPWAEISTGSLGQGFSTGVGMALGLKHQNQSSARIYTILGDGELQEGQVWEGAMFAAHYKLDNLCVLVDYNKLQSDDLNANIMGLEPLSEKWRSFGWHALEIDGHSFKEIIEALAVAKEKHHQPTVIIAHTIKGKGVSYMENSPLWHGSVKLRDEEYQQALSDIGKF